MRCLTAASSVDRFWLAFPSAGVCSRFEFGLLVDWLFQLMISSNDPPQLITEHYEFFFGNYSTSPERTLAKSVRTQSTIRIASNVRAEKTSNFRQFSNESAIRISFVHFKVSSQRMHTTCLLNFQVITFDFDFFFGNYPDSFESFRDWLCWWQK